jgi:hypothetical protein
MLEIWILCIHLQYENPKINPISYAFFTVSARPGSDLDKERKKPYVLLAYPSHWRERERETEIATTRKTELIFTFCSLPSHH